MGQYRHAQLELIRHLESEINIEEFNNFVEQSRKKTPVSAGMNAFLKTIDALYNPDPMFSVWDQRGVFIKHLREALAHLESLEGEAKRYLEAICYVRFTQVDLSSYYGKLIPEMFQETGKPSITSPTSIQQLQRAIYQTADSLKPSLPYGKGGTELNTQKLIMVIGEGDPLGEDNIPYVRSKTTYIKQGIEREVTILRHGTPTVEYNRVCERCPEYEAYIEFAKAKGENILHVVHEGNDAGEMKRVNVRIAAADRHENYFALRLPLDGPFFEGPIKVGACSVSTATFCELKHALMESFFDDKIAAQTGIIVSKRVRDQLSRERLGGIFDEVLTTFIYPGENIGVALGRSVNGEKSPTLPSSRQEKQAYLQMEVKSERRKEIEKLKGTFKGAYQATIVLFYTLLTHHLQFACNASHVKTPCKDDIDRGNLMKVFGEVYRAILLDKENDPEVLRAILDHTMMAPFHVKRQGIIPGRGALLDVGLDYLRNIGPLEKERLKNSPLHLGFKPTRMKFPNGSKIPIHPTVETAHSMEEYDAILAQFFLEEGAVVEGSIEQFLTSRLASNRLGIHIIRLPSNEFAVMKKDQPLCKFEVREQEGGGMYYWGCMDRALIYQEGSLKRVGDLAGTGLRVVRGLGNLIGEVIGIV